VSKLQLQGVSRRFGGLVAVSQLSFSVEPGRITALIGPNGAGKTTTFNMVSGLIRPTGGRIILGAVDITNLPPHRICRAGIGRSFQTPHLFGQMTVLENVMVGTRVERPTGLLATGLRFPSTLREDDEVRARAMEQLDFMNLGHLATRRAGALALGQQRMVEVARALATQPSILMLDEPAAGLTQAEVLGLRETLAKIRAQGIAVFLVEHNMRFVLRTAEHVVVLNFGEKLTEGPPEAIASDDRVIAAYLGRRQEDEVAQR
jgi:branched-chain amino acid transport system ATP-binding protein